MKTNSASLKYNIDLLGMTVSIACAIHCALLPILMTLGTLGALSFLANPMFEPIVIGISGALALVSLLPTYLRHRDQPFPLLAMSFGLGLVGASRFAAFEAFETPLTVIGTVLIAFAHFINWRYLMSLKK